MIVVGERLNSSRAPVLEAMKARDEGFLIGEARRQAVAGAHYLDINCAALMGEEIDALQWAVPLLQTHVDVPLAIDTTSSDAARAGLGIHKGRAMLNSVTGEHHRIDGFLPIIREHRPRVVVLCMDDDGIPEDADKEVSIARTMVDVLIKEGISTNDIFIDPLVRPIAVDHDAANLFLESLEKIKKALPEIKTIAGISNVSYGLPKRESLNRALLVLALSRGLDAAILDPQDREIMAAIHSTQALVGQDPSLRAYLSFIRKHRP
jgi:cobalamin-dependent methionine synthase I